MHAMNLFVVLLLTMSNAAPAATAVARAQDDVAATATTGTVPAYTPPVPLLWKISDPDNALYLLGSFHLLKDDDYPLSADIGEAFVAADRVVFEVAPEQLEDPDTSRKFIAAAGYDDEQTLSDVLPPRLREKLHRLMARQGGAIAQVDGYEPWFINLSLLLGLSQSLGFSAEQGLDRHLMDRVAAEDKPTGGLETLDDQLHALDAMPMQEQIVGLRDFLDRPQEMPGLLADLHQAWRDGDVTRLDGLTRVEMLEKTPETYRIINVERNIAWVPQLQAMLDDSGDEDVLVVVGALHLLGKDGLVEKMREEGYEVERICSACEVEVPVVED